MAEFLWKAVPPYGVCFGCGTSSHDRGFVQTFADVDVKQDGDIVGVADVFFCGDCLFQMGRMVGMASPQETEDFARREHSLIEKNEKLSDEIRAWQERFLKLASLSEEEIMAFQSVQQLNNEIKELSIAGSSPDPESVS